MISRRNVLKGAGVLALASAGYGIVWEPYRLTIERSVIPSGAVRGITIAQLSDLHFRDDESMLEKLLLAFEALKPDAIALTGDLIDSKKYFESLALADFIARIGRIAPAVAIMGNWDHWSTVGLRVIRQYYEKAGIPLLVDEWAELPTSKGPLWFYGTDDALAGTPQALTDAQNREFVLLSHCPGPVPRFIDGIQGRKPIAVLSGHTHGGQVHLPDRLSVLPPLSGRFVAGWYDIQGSHLYVSRGIGTSIAPIRFGRPPELGVIAL